MKTQVYVWQQPSRIPITVAVTLIASQRKDLRGTFTTPVALRYNVNKFKVAPQTLNLKNRNVLIMTLLLGDIRYTGSTFINELCYTILLLNLIQNQQVAYICFRLTILLEEDLCLVVRGI